MGNSWGAPIGSPPESVSGLRFSQGNVKCNGRCQSGSGRCCHQTPNRWTDTNSQWESVSGAVRTKQKSGGIEVNAPGVFDQLRLGQPRSVLISVLWPYTLKLHPASSPAI